MNFTVELPEINNKSYDIRDFGAINGGKSCDARANAAAINHAIQEANKNGGGRVVIPTGVWMSGPIALLSHVELHVETGAILLFDKQEELYPLYQSDFEGTETIRALSPIHAEYASHIAITGNGTIDGNGQLWRPIKQFKVTERQWKSLLEKSTYTVEANDGNIWLPTESSYNGWLLSFEHDPALDNLESAQAYWDFFRPVMVRLYHCDHVLIENVTLQNSPAWNLHPCFCEHITIRNANIRNPYYAQNGDGLDLESCKYADITDTTFDVGDDAICMKSGKGKKAREIKVPTEYVRISNCTVYHGHGGFVVGSEMSRGIRHVEVKNCSFIGTDVGIRFKSALGRGGIVEDITLDSIQMTDIVNEAIIFTMGYVLDYRESAKDTAPCSKEDIPYFKNITMKNIICNSAKTGFKADGLDLGMLGTDTPVIDEIKLQDSVILAKTDKTIQNAGTITFENVVWN